MNNINNNGIKYVDLGLPSGTLWATRNIGATRPSDSGDYFHWGEVRGYSEDEIDACDRDNMFTWYDYKWYLSGNIVDQSLKFKKYIVRNDTLMLEDDAAHMIMGGDWHIPSPKQIKELINNTTNTWITLSNGASGMRFTSKRDPSESIFIPAAGIVSGGTIYDKGVNGYIWSSMLDTNIFSQVLKIRSDCGAKQYYCEREIGLPIRGVIDNKNNNSKNNTTMNENLNLVEKLKEVPKGTKLWSPIIGYCEFVEINEDNAFPITCRPLKTNDHWYFRGDGSFTTYDGAECMLFPSKDNRDWSSFKAPKKHKEFNPFQKVLVMNLLSENKGIWQGTLYSYYLENSDKHILIDGSYVTDEYIIPYDGNEDKLGKIIDIKG